MNSLDKNDVNGLETIFYSFDESKGVYVAKKSKPFVLGSTVSGALSGSIQMQLMQEQIKIANAGFECLEIES